MKARNMHNSRRSKTLIEADQHSLEFTSGQLILAICALLVLCLLCFLTGVVAGKLEFGSSLTQVADDDDAKSPATAGASPQSPDRGTATSSASPSNTKTENTASSAPKPEAAKRTPPPRVADRPSPQTPPAIVPAAPTEAAGSAQAAPKASSAKSEESAPKWIDQRPGNTEPEPPEAATKPPVTTASSQLAQAQSNVTPKEATPPPKEEAKPAKEVAKGNFTIQVAAYQVKNKTLAENYVKSLKDKQGVSADMVKSKDGKYYQILVGRYPDRAAAEKAQQELKKKDGFAECIVKAL